MSFGMDFWNILSSIAETHIFAIMAYTCSKQPKGNGEESERFTCVSPISILSCWIRTKKSKRPTTSNKLGEEKEFGRFDDDEKKMESATLAPNYAESCQSCTPCDDLSGNLKEVKFFNLGVGFGLVYLLAESKDELNKIKDLHKEMEVELQSFKDRLLANDHAQNKGIGSFQELQSSMSLKDPQIRSFIVSRQQSRKKMNLLEEELKAELEHLQLHIESETMLYQEDKYSEIVIEDTAPEGSFYTTKYGEIIDPAPQVIRNEEQCGVCPHELESRLHELLQARQQERINELEEALLFANQKIHEKEKELSLWKDTAKVFFQQVPVPNGRRALTHQ